jgi:hypothetical protein
VSAQYQQAGSQPTVPTDPIANGGRMWTENVTWFSNEEGKKGRIEVGQLADLIVPDRDYFCWAESDIADTTSDLTIVGGKIVYAKGDFKSDDGSPPPPAMPDWSPVRSFGGYGNW